MTRLALDGADLRQGLRNLRHGLRRCRDCPLGDACPHLAEHHRLVDLAIEAATAGLRLP